MPSIHTNNEELSKISTKVIVHSVSDLTTRRPFEIVILYMIRIGNVSLLLKVV